MTVQTLGDDMFDARPRRVAWQWQPLIPIGIAAFALSALISYHVRQPEVRSALQTVVRGIYLGIGFVPACMFFILVLAWSSIWFVRGELERPGARILRLLGFTLATAILVNLRGDDGLPPAVHTGVIGHWLASRLMHVFTYVPSILMVSVAFFATCVLATDWFFARFFDDLLTAGPRARAGEGLDTGVEAAATEHLKGLAQVSAAPLPATAVLDRETDVEDGDPDAADVAEIEAGLDPMASAIAETAEDEGAARLRLSAFERRRLAAAELAAAIERASQEAEAEDEAEAEAAAEAAEAGAVDVEPWAGDADDAEAEAAELVDTELEKEAVVELDVATGAAEDAVGDDEPVVRIATMNEDAAAPSEVAESESDLESSSDEDADDLGTIVSVPTVPPRTVPSPGLGELPFAPAANLPPPSAHLGAPEALESPGTPDGEAAAGELERLAAQAAAEAVAEADAAADADATAERESAELPPAELPPAELPPAGRSSGAEATAADSSVDATPALEPMVAIPRPPEGVRQRRLFAPSGPEESLVAEAMELVLGSRRASASHLQRKLRIDYEQAMSVLAVLASRGIIELAEGETQGRVLQ